MDRCTVQGSPEIHLGHISQILRGPGSVLHKEGSSGHYVATHRNVTRKPGQNGPLNLLEKGAGNASAPVATAAHVAFALGAFLVLWSAYIHFHLWDETDGYRHIATIGPLFLAQSIGGLVVAIVILAVRRIWAAVVGIGFAASTVVGFLLRWDCPRGSSISRNPGPHLSPAWPSPSRSSPSSCCSWPEPCVSLGQRVRLAPLRPR